MNTKHVSAERTPEATKGGLIKSTLMAGLIGTAILVLVWLPAEYGLDPTGAGRLLGLTEMGEIKQQLAGEAEAETQQAAVNSTINPTIEARLSDIESRLAAIAAAVGAEDAAASPSPASAAQKSTGSSPWRDEYRQTLAPGEGVEVKLVMREGMIAQFEWTANGAVLNHDTHGNGGGERIMYERGRGVPGQAGELQAAFDGQHGWFWRNRTDDPVTFTLRTAGAYERFVQP